MIEQYPFFNPIILAVGEIVDVSLQHTLRTINALYVHTNDRRFPIRFSVRAEHGLGAPRFGHLIVGVGRYYPGSPPFIRCTYARFVDPDGGDFDAAFDEAACQLQRQVAALQRRVKLIEQYQKLSREVA